jgi:signal transduction histidine kinase
VRETLNDLGQVLAGHRAVRTAVLAGEPWQDAVKTVTALERDLEIDELLERAPEALELARDGLSRVATIVRSMTVFAHPHRRMAPANLTEAIRATVIVAASEYKMVAELILDLCELPLVNCHLGEINQVILNLVINAAHAIRDVVGQTGAKGKIDVRTRCDGGEVEIAISDTGTGIPPAIRDKIYDPFFTTKEVGRGTGQGLAIVRSVVVDKHGGSLRFETQTGAGTTFFVRLPVAAELPPELT